MPLSASGKRILTGGLCISSACSRSSSLSFEGRRREIKKQSWNLDSSALGHDDLDLSIVFQGCFLALPGPSGADCPIDRKGNPVARLSSALSLFECKPPAQPLTIGTLGVEGQPAKCDFTPMNALLPFLLLYRTHLSTCLPLAMAPISCKVVGCLEQVV